MNKESLEIISEKLHKIVNDPRIPIFDKVEIMINLTLFLENYEENIKVLRKYNIDKNI